MVLGGGVGWFQFWWMLLVLVVSVWVWMGGVGLVSVMLGLVSVVLQRERVKEVDKEERYELLIYVILLDNLYYHNELYVKIRHGMWGVLLNGLLK